jgi:hypothetical protein
MTVVTGGDVDDRKHGGATLAHDAARGAYRDFTFAVVDD